MGTSSSQLVKVPDELRPRSSRRMVFLTCLEYMMTTYLAIRVLRVLDHWVDRAMAHLGPRQVSLRALLRGDIYPRPPRRPAAFLVRRRGQAKRDRRVLRRIEAVLVRLWIRRRRETELRDRRQRDRQYRGGAVCNLRQLYDRIRSVRPHRHYEIEDADSLRRFRHFGGIDRYFRRAVPYSRRRSRYQGDAIKLVNAVHRMQLQEKEK